MSRYLNSVALWALLAAVVVAQPTVHEPHFSVSLHAQGIGASGESMAVDFRNNVYIHHRPVITIFPPPDSIARVTPGGTVIPDHVAGIGMMTQLAYNPVDGQCYVATHSPLLPVIMSTVHRIETSGGTTVVGNVPLIARGLTIDDRGHFIFGAQSGPSGPGLYRWAQSPSSFALIYMGPGFGQNGTLQSIARSSDVLIADGWEVRRWTPLAVVPVPYWSYPITPNSIVNVTSLARGPMNQLGVGALIGVNELITLCTCGTGYAFPGDRTSGANTPFASETYPQPLEGLRLVASGIRQDMFWLTDGLSTTPVAGKQLYRVSQQAAHGSQGSLITNVVGTSSGMNSANFHVYGPAAGGAPFLLGALPLGITPYAVPWDATIFVPAGGWILNIFHTNYIPLLDGIGIFGPPTPFAIIPPGGHFHMMVTLPPAGGFTIWLEALILSDEAPNGFFFISNRDTMTIP